MNKCNLQNPTDPHLSRQISPLRFKLLTIAAVIALIIAAGGALAALSFRPAQLEPNGQIAGGFGSVYFQPFNWQGQKLPLLPYIPGGSVLETGHWLLVIYYHDCSDCRQALAAVATHLKSDPRHHVAIIQIPPFGNLPQGIAAPEMLQLRLDGSRRWRPPFLPILLDLDNGKVTAARSYVPGVWWGF
ncbi:MAG TPA: hypothetical protein VMG59_05150 [Phycisphaerae bacterium]|nr:hypothetical protein [Phycisphaerae bacterium]